MKEESLTHLFEFCASITDKQTILFYSSQPKTEENEEEKDEQSPSLIEELSNMVKEKGLNFNYIGIDPKAITLINDQNYGIQERINRNTGVDLGKQG